MSASMNEKQALLPKASRPSKSEFVLVIHGGANTMARKGSTPEQRASYKAALTAALNAGYAVLAAGGEAMDAAVAAVSSMEDCPLFNSAKGAVFNVEGKNELEASLMLSTPPSTHPSIPASRRLAACTLLTHARNPSQLVRALYLAPAASEHPFLSGAPAEALGAELGAALVDPSYYFTEARWHEHRRGLGLPDEPLPAHPEEGGGGGGDGGMRVPLDTMPTGTVGAVALDARGCIAACTSTGGLTNKLAGRIGDTPHAGAGFWADRWRVRGLRRVLARLCGRPAEQAVGVSGTGDGDYFIRRNAAATIAHRMQFLHEPVGKAAKAVVEELRREGGIGGVIALDGKGNVAMPLNCSGMYRGVIRPDGVPKTAIFDDDVLE